MARGDQVKALIQASKTQGWDPTQIEGESLTNFDQPTPTRGAVGGHFVGELPGGAPNGWPPNWDNGREDPPLTGDIFANPTFAHPDVSRETATGGSELPTNDPPNLGVTPYPEPLPQHTAGSEFTTPFDTPVLRENVNRRTRNANPYLGMGDQ